MIGRISATKASKVEVRVVDRVRRDMVRALDLSRSGSGSSVNKNDSVALLCAIRTKR